MVQFKTILYRPKLPQQLQQDISKHWLPKYISIKYLLKHSESGSISMKKSSKSQDISTEKQRKRPESYEMKWHIKQGRIGVFGAF